MSKVTTLIRSIDKEIIKTLFRRFSSRYGHAWNSRHKTDEDWIYCANDWLHDLKEFDLLILKKAVEKAYLLYKDFPPTLPQLIDLCLKESGLPSESDIINLMVRREFNHPLVKMVFDKIGSWAISNGKTEEITRKTRQYYDECVANFRSNEKESWSYLKSYSEQKLLEHEETKIPTQKQLKSFSERMAEYMELANSQKMKLGAQAHPEFPSEKIKKGGREFDKDIYAEYKRYLLSVEEVLSLTLPRLYAYDRICFLRELNTIAHLKEFGYPGTKGSDENASHTRNSGPKKVYTNWVKE